MARHPSPQAAGQTTRRSWDTSCTASGRNIPTYRGTEIRGGNHGFLRHFLFDTPEVGADSLTYTVPADRVPREAYPLAVSLRLTYRLGPDGLRVVFEFQNEEDVDAHVSFGLHPGFAISSLSTTRVLFPAGTYERHWAPGNFLDGRVDVIPFSGGEMPFSKRSSRIPTCLGSTRCQTGVSRWTIRFPATG